MTARADGTSADAGGAIDGGPHVPRRLFGSIDEPVDGSLTSGTLLVVRGWHAWRGRPVLAVAVSAAVGSSGSVVPAERELRPDVARAHRDTAFEACGWRSEVDVAGLTAGPGESGPGPRRSARGAGASGDVLEVELTVTLWPALDEAPVGLPSFKVRFAPDLGEGVPAPGTGVGSASHQASAAAAVYQGTLEEPAEGSRLGREVVRVTGWTLLDASHVSSVEILVNGRSVGRARIGLSRPDVHDALPVPHAWISGFEARVDLRKVEPERSLVHLAAVAVSLDGRRTVFAQRWCAIAAAKALSVPAPAISGKGHARGLPSEASSPVGPRGDVDGDGGPLSLLVFTHDLGRGGAQLWLSELLRRAGAGDRFACTVVSPSGGPDVEELEHMGVNVHVTQAFPVSSADAFEGRVAELAGWLGSMGHDAVLVNTVRAFCGVEVAGRLGLPVVWAIHESWSPDEVWSALEHPGSVPRAVLDLFSSALASADAVVFAAEATRRVYDAFTVKGRSVVVPYGVDVGEIARYCKAVARGRARRKTGAGADGAVVTCIGTIEERKGQTVLAEAFSSVVKDHPTAKLVLVGAIDTAYCGALARYVRDSGLEGCVSIVALTSEVYPWYRSADLFVLASDLESLPRSVLEAMAFGVPVAVTGVYGVPELITDGVTGELFEPRDAAAAERAIRRCLERDPAETRRMVDAARTLIRAEHDSAGYARDVVALLKGLRADRTLIPAAILDASGRRARNGGDPTTITASRHDRPAGMTGQPR